MGQSYILAIALGLFALAIQSPTVVSANGGHSGTREVFSGSVGSYDVWASTNSMVGNVHITLTLSKSDGSIADPPPQIRGSAQGPPDPQGISRTVAPQQALSASDEHTHDHYTLDIPVEASGQWVFSLMVDDPDGQHSIDFAVEIMEGTGAINWALRVGGPILLVGFAWGFLEWRRRVAKNQKDKSPQLDNLL